MSKSDGNGPRGILFSGRIVRVEHEVAEFPDGQRIPLEIVHHPGGAAVVAIDEQSRVCLLRQYRHVVGDWLWELPAGKRTPGLAALATARAELAEEAGLSASSWQSLGAIHTSPGIFTEVVHLYLATDLEPVPQALEQGELLEVHWHTLTGALQLAASGEISDAKTIIGLMRAADHLST